MSWKVTATYKCKVCGHEWETEDIPPTQCPNCLESGPYIFERMKFNTHWLAEV